jgi:hypothetical protein
MKPKRLFLVGLAVSLSLAALLGIGGLLAGRTFGEFTGKALSTMVTVAVCSALALAAWDARERGSWRALMFGSLVFTALGMVYFLWVIWIWSGWRGDNSEIVLKAMALTATWGVAPPMMAQIVALQLTRETRKWRWIPVGLVFLLALLITGAVVLEVEGDLYYRFVGVVAILACLTAIGARILQRVQGVDKVSSAESTKLELQVTCPRCLLTQTIQSGHSRCARCRLKFHLEIEEPRCPQCNYLLHQLTSPRCPECGRALAPEEIAPPAAPAPAPAPLPVTVTAGVAEAPVPPPPDSPR